MSIRLFIKWKNILFKCFLSKIKESFSVQIFHQFTSFQIFSQIKSIRTWEFSKLTKFQFQRYLFILILFFNSWEWNVFIFTLCQNCQHSLIESARTVFILFIEAKDLQLTFIDFQSCPRRCWMLNNFNFLLI
jgi:hypothetical protein